MQNNRENMTNEALVQHIGEKYMAILAQENDEDYAICPANWAKMLAVLAYFHAETARLGGSVAPVCLRPCQRHGFVEATFAVFDASGESLHGLAHVLRLADVFAVEPLEAGEIRLGVNINHVFEKKKQ